MILEYKNDIEVEITGGNRKNIKINKNIGVGFNNELKQAGVDYEYCNGNRFIIHYTDFDKFKSVLDNFMNN